MSENSSSASLANRFSKPLSSCSSVSAQRVHRHPYQQMLPILKNLKKQHLPCIGTIHPNSGRNLFSAARSISRSTTQPPSQPLPLPPALLTVRNCAYFRLQSTLRCGGTSAGPMGSLSGRTGHMSNDRRRWRRSRGKGGVNKGSRLGIS